MPTLAEQDAWSLFLEKVSGDVFKNESLLPIAKSIVAQCAGLPLAIVTVASSMKGIRNVHEWRNALNELSGRVKGVTGLDETNFGLPRGLWKKWIANKQSLIKGIPY
ncbi:NB-ARC - like 10 [Theobroma cacao]|nr:NB-ARC - like 10 [Theobroma cacao]